jgi:hypothetical protein
VTAVADETPVTEIVVVEPAAVTAPGADSGEHALRVAFIEAVTDAMEAMEKKTRAAAQKSFAAVRAKGHPQQEIRLDGGKIGSISIKDATVKATVDDEEKLLEFARENLTGAIEQYIDPNFVSSIAVIEMVRDVFPGSVCERIRPETRKELIKQMEANNGFVTIKGTGVTALLGTVKKTPPTGEFTLTGTNKEARRAALIAAWQRGDLPESVTGSLTLKPQAITAGGDAG